MPEFILAAECEHCRRDNEMVKRALAYPGVLIHNLQNIQKKCIHCGSTGTFNYRMKLRRKLPEDNPDALQGPQGEGWDGGGNEPIGDETVPAAEGDGEGEGVDVPRKPRRRSRRKKAPAADGA